MPYHLKKEPDWGYEAVHCLIDPEGERISDLLNHCELYGKSEKELEKMIEPALAFRREIYPKIKALSEKFPAIMPYLTLRKQGKEICQKPLIMTLNYFLTYQKSDTKKAVDQLFQDFFFQLQEGKKRIPITCAEELIQLLDSLEGELHPEEKLQLILFYTNRYQIVKELKQFKRQAVSICRGYKDLVAGILLCQQQSIEKKDLMEYFKESGLTLSLKESDYDFTIYPSIIGFNEASIFLYEKEEQKNVSIHLGVFYLDKQNQSTSAAQIGDRTLVSKLKAVGDNTRLRIIHLLAQRPMYLQEIANALSLTPATVSHHMNVLHHEKLIELTVYTEVMNFNNKNIYYTLSRKKLAALAKQLEELAHENE